jgi:hypothetical protein
LKGRPRVDLFYAIRGMMISPNKKKTKDKNMGNNKLARYNDCNQTLYDEERSWFKLLDKRVINDNESK